MSCPYPGPAGSCLLPLRPHLFPSLLPPYTAATLTFFLFLLGAELLYASGPFVHLKCRLLPNPDLFLAASDMVLWSELLGPLFREAFPDSSVTECFHPFPAETYH